MFTCGIRANGYKHIANPESITDLCLDDESRSILR